jgi:hypothetical protein
MLPGINVRLLRAQHRSWCVWERTKDRLASDNDQLRLTGHLGGGRDHVLELIASQGALANFLDDLAPLGLGQKTRERRVLA